MGFSMFQLNRGGGVVVSGVSLTLAIAGFAIGQSQDANTPPPAIDEPAAIEDSAPPFYPHTFLDVTKEIGLDAGVIGTSVSRCLFADLNDDGFADAVIDRHRVFLNFEVSSRDSPNVGRSFVEMKASNLRKPERGTIVVFADINNDGHLDAISTQLVDGHNMNWDDHGQRTAWQRGNGDGTFESRVRLIYAAPTASTSSIGIGDVNLDSKLDLFLGNWYVVYGDSYDGFSNDLLIQSESSQQHMVEEKETSDAGDDSAADEVVDIWVDWRRIPLPTDRKAFDVIADAGGRPTYGTMIADLNNNGKCELIELNYGRRWNRLWQFSDARASIASETAWADTAKTAGMDGDFIRHGRYPDWLKERAKTDKRFDREDEPPFRANGNTFDCEVNDVDNDGDFDIFLATIAHGWAGESSDRSRFLINRMSESGELVFAYEPQRSVDRVPADVDNWNQGDLFSILADFDQDGLVDLLLSSGDYPDNQRLRFYKQMQDGSFEDHSETVGLDHDGSQQLSVADINGDGSLDIIVGQTFARYPREMKEGREPRLCVYLNRPPAPSRSIILRLEGDLEAGSNRDALGAIVEAQIGDTTMTRQLIGVGGHSGKQRDFIVHFGLGEASTIDALTVHWPNADRSVQIFSGVDAGIYTIRQGGELVRRPASK